MISQKTLHFLHVQEPKLDMEVPRLEAQQLILSGEICLS